MCPVCKDGFANLGSLGTHVSRKRIAGHPAYQTLEIRKNEQVALTAHEQPLHSTVALQSSKLKCQRYEDTPDVRESEMSTPNACSLLQCAKLRLVPLDEGSHPGRAAVVSAIRYIRAATHSSMALLASI